MKRKLDENNEPAPKESQPAGTENGAKKPSFTDFGLDPRLVQAIAQEQYREPTLVQAKAIPLGLEGKDVLAKAKTGSGKTAAYLLPVLQAILKRKQTNSAAFTSALILVPTRELADQVHKVIESLAAFCAKDIQAVKLTDKISEAAQRSLLLNSPDIVVSTPARTWSNISSSALSLDKLTHLVLDEADLVLSYGYEDDLRNVSKKLPKGIQTILMSATLTTEVTTLKDMFAHSPVVLNLEEKDAEGEGIEQYVVKCAEDEKFLLIYVIFKLKLIKGKSIIFVSDVDRCYRLKLYFEQFGIRSCILNSELPVNSRIHVVEEFNKNVYDIIIACDENEVIGDEESPKDGAEAATAAEGAKAESKTEEAPKKKRGRPWHGALFRDPREQYRKHVPTSIESTEKDEKVLARIEKQQAKLDKEVKPYNFDMEQVEAFRYRMNDALRSVTRVSIREARTRELREELLKSEKLKRHFEENPNELHHLRHDGELRAARTQAHLKHVPDYLLPAEGAKGLTAQEIGFVPFTKYDKKKRTKKFKVGKKRSDPLRSFKARSKAKK
ncbi:unnamed protein product [Parascedosporium putredinis]|uniref:RNA helicase n=1 Tax=Parascedosporium putredinis TaxID=1442378 RepID=A0A9P1GX48_9PEZI|nr:unnamed protein product [Parascedosporium putredinis]CAI7988691.1 unnamed protein product [Parascedosporium putredinis]